MTTSCWHPRGASVAALLVAALVLCANAEIVTYDLTYSGGSGGSLTGVWSFDTNEIVISEHISDLPSMALTLTASGGTPNDGVFEASSFPPSTYYITHVVIDFSQDLVPQTDDINFYNVGPWTGTFPHELSFYTLVSAIPSASGSAVVGDPHFFVSDTHIYDWKQVGTYNYLEFETHGIELSVDDYAGCDGQMTGEFVRAVGITNSGTTVVASCDGIYHGDNTTLAAHKVIRVETACVSIDVVLTNGYLNLYNVESSCPVIGGVHKAISDHAATNAGGWWEVVDGKYTRKFHEVPKVVPLEKRPVTILVDF